jgi:ubiquinol-cytochrome c reductase cytochrome b subunit
VLWLWGGFSVGNVTLHRFFVLHVIIPFIMTALVIIHILLLHEFGSNNPLGISFLSRAEISLHPYYTLKDFLGMQDVFSVLFILCFFRPDIAGHPDNYIFANPLVTPAHIVPEWYFLPFYAILRSIPDKLTGVLGLAFAILCLFLVPLVTKSFIRSMALKPISSIIFWVFIFVSILLGVIGSEPVEYPFYTIGQLATFTYFVYFLLVNPLGVAIENYIVMRKNEARSF